METSISTNLKDQLRGQIEAQKDEVATGKAPSMMARASQEQVGGWYGSFGVLLASGYPLARCLAMMAKTTSNKDLAATTRQLGMAVENGMPINKAMARSPWYFTPVACSVIAAAEETATVGPALTYLAESMETEAEVREKATQAMSYPAVVSVIASLVVLGILYFAAPEFRATIVESGGTIDGWAGIIFGISDAVHNPLVPIAFLASVSGTAFLLHRWKRHSPQAFYSALARVPVFGRLLMLASLSRFVDIFHMLSRNDVPIPRALELAHGTVDNAVLGSAIDDMRKNIAAGKTMGEALQAYSQFPPTFVDMMGLAEESGRLDELLPGLSRTMRQRLFRTAARITLVVEPVMIAILGVAVLGIVLAFFMPYFDLIGSLGTS